MNTNLNVSKRFVIGSTVVKSIPGLGWSFEEGGYHHLFFFIQSASLNKVRRFQLMFNDMYRQELEDYDFEAKAEAEIMKRSQGRYSFYIIGKSKKPIS